MDNLPRFTFYSSGIFLVSAAFTLFTSEFLIKTGEPGITGLLFLLGFGLVYMNIVFVISRRFMRRDDGPSPAPIIFGILVAISPAIWVFVFESGLAQVQQIIYAVVVIFACGLGAHFGHSAGLKAQKKFKKQLEDYYKQSEQVPDELKRPHDTLNKN